MKFWSKYKKSIHENASENIVCEMAIILSGWGRWSWIDWLLYIQLFRRYVQLPIRVQGICSPLLLGHHSNPSTDDICSCQIGRFGPIRLATRWRHDMETLSSSLALYAWNSPVTGGFHRQRASYAERWCIFFAIQAELSNKQLVIWNTMALIWRHCNGVKWYIYIYTVEPLYNTVHYRRY